MTKAVGRQSAENQAKEISDWLFCCSTGITWFPAHSESYHLDAAVTTITTATPVRGFGCLLQRKIFPFCVLQESGTRSLGARNLK